MQAEKDRVDAVRVFLQKGGVAGIGKKGHVEGCHGDAFGIVCLYGSVEEPCRAPETINAGALDDIPAVPGCE
jgi:hypothetical protein